MKKLSEKSRSPPSIKLAENLAENDQDKK